MSKGERTKQRMLEVTGELMRRRGFHGTGLSEIVERSRAPKGSLYFHFPGGKDELAAAALEQAAGAWRARLLEVIEAGGAKGVGRAIKRACEAIAAELEASKFANGCPLATVTLEVAAENPGVREVAEHGYKSWEALIAARLGAGGIAAARAESLATLVLSSVEGALILSRAYADTTPLRRVAAQLAALVEAAQTSVNERR
jgi:TetR/AcrR family transcriptional repressor of lmrAB and yxaGH operons